MTELAATRFRLATFARHAAAASPLYSLIAQECADDDDVVALAASAPDDDGQAMLLLAAVHRLLQDSDSSLRDFYPTLGGRLQPSARTWREFRQFALDRADAVRSIVRIRFVQTNEVQRAAVLYPAVAHAARHMQGPLGLLEVGCSAGLLLHLDRYSYSYRTQAGNEIRAGSGDSPLHLVCDIPNLTNTATFGDLSIAARVGLDRHPIECRTKDDVAWLEACIWADHPHRLVQLRRALEARDARETHMLQGDAVDDLAVALSAMPSTTTPVVLTSWVLTYLSPAKRAQFVAKLDAFASQRDVWWVANETFESCLSHLDHHNARLEYMRSGRCVLSLLQWGPDGRRVHVLGTTDAHGHSLRRVAGTSWLR